MNIIHVSIHSLTKLSIHSMQIIFHMQNRLELTISSVLTPAVREMNDLRIEDALVCKGG